jgi:hypothetical protein
MGPGNQGRRSPAWLRALAGIEAGILGGVAMLAWPAVSSLVDLQSIWVVPNLLGSALSGHAVLHRGFGWVTVAGLGLHLFVAGSVGICFALVVRESRSRLRAVLLGIITGLCWYYVSQTFFWRRLGVFVMVYSPPRAMLFGHLLFGLTLGWFPNFLRSLRRVFLPGAEVLVETHETAPAPDAVE